MVDSEEAQIIIILLVLPERTARRSDTAGIYLVYFSRHAFHTPTKSYLMKPSAVHQVECATYCLLCIYGLDLLHASVYTCFLFSRVRLHLGGLSNTAEAKIFNSIVLRQFEKWETEVIQWPVGVSVPLVVD